MKRSRTGHSSITALCVMLACSIIGSCAPVATQLVVVLRTDVPLNWLRELESSVTREGQVATIAAHRVVFPGPVWPLSYGVIAARFDDPRPLLITTSLRFVGPSGMDVIEKTARVQLRPMRILQLDLSLDSACTQRSGSPPRCGPGQTCESNTCVSIDRTDLPELNP
jgi:hypothetical protein